MLLNFSELGAVSDAVGLKRILLSVCFRAALPTGPTELKIK